MEMHPKESKISLQNSSPEFTPELLRDYKQNLTWIQSGSGIYLPLQVWNF